MYVLCMYGSVSSSHSILFLISQTSYRTYKIISSYELACPVIVTVQAWIPEEQVRDLFPAKKHYNYIVTI